MNSPSTPRTLLVILAILSALTFATAKRVCEDNINFSLRRNKSKNCEWIGKIKRRKKKQCRKSTVRKQCPKTCDSCADQIRTDCPENKYGRLYVGKNGRNASCEKFEPGLECGFDHEWTGCHRGDMACTPTFTYTCPKPSAASTTRKGRSAQQTWESIAEASLMCEPTRENKPYGQYCNQKECPPFAPLAGRSCSWYQGHTSCDYGFEWTGCNEDSLECSPLQFFTCDPVSDTWRVAVVDPKPCGKDLPEDIPRGTCNPNDPCPPMLPLDGSSCTAGSEETCPYDYQVVGCTEGDTTCSPISHASCDPVTQTWSVTKNIHFCGTGESCYPETYFDCPNAEPSAGDRCTKYKGDQNCMYNPITMGCHEDDLFCGYSSSGFCDYDSGRWVSVAATPLPCKEKERRSDAETKPFLPIGETCDPSACPLSQPKLDSSSYCGAWEGDRDETCYYQYKARGCSSDSLFCEPDVSYTCKDDRWKMETQPVLSCTVPEDPRSDKPCDPEPTGCPLQSPEDQSDCSAYQGGDDVCHYKYQSFGCSKNDLSCVPSESYSCTDKKQWELHPSIAIFCQSEKEDQGPVRRLSGRDDSLVSTIGIGNPCHPKEEPSFGGAARSAAICPMEQPTLGNSCEGSGLTKEQGCPYAYTAVGCTPEDLECMPIHTFYCDAKNVWQQSSHSVEFCLDVPVDWPSDECDPVTFDPFDYSLGGGTIDEKGACPSKKPEVNDKCEPSDYADDECGYGYEVAGCTPDTLRCIPFETFTCEMDGKYKVNTWHQGMTTGMETCMGKAENWPAGETCDPDTFDASDFSDNGDGSDAKGTCPRNAPKAGTGCSKTNGLTPLAGCSYDYSVVGCTADSLQCLPISTFECNDAENGKWTEKVVARIECVPPKGSPTGKCNPETFDPVNNTKPKPVGDGICPLTEPQQGEDCSRTGEASCPFDYIVTGCSPEAARCQAISTYYCSNNDNGDGWKWEVAMMRRRELSIEHCRDPPGGSCDGSVYIKPSPDPDASDFSDNGDGSDAKGTCPRDAPKAGTGCSKTNGLTPLAGCSYDYSVVGCTADSLQCLPISTFECNDAENGKWIEKVLARMKCAPPEGSPIGKCDPKTFDPFNNTKPKPVGDGICPLTEPQQGEDCSRTGEASCPFDYIVTGCSPEAARCQAISTYYCSNDYGDGWKWEVAMMRRRELTIEHCPDPPGGSCDGSVYIEPSPIKDQSLDPLLLT